MVYYKCVSRRRGKLYSAYVGSRMRPELWDMAVEYIPNVWVKPKHENSQLMVFSDIESARLFSWGKEIWECEVKNPKDRGIFVTTDVFNMKSNFLKILKLKKQKKKYIHLLANLEIPDDTIFCSEVMLTRMVQYFDGY